VVINYYFKEKPAGEVKLTIADSKGEEIRSFSSTREVAEWGGRWRRDIMTRLPAEAGANQFVWNMLYPGANIIPDTTLRGAPRPPIAVPGTYQVKLEVGEQSFTQSFELVKDPRVTYDTADLQKQFDFMVAVRDKLTETHDAVRKMRDMRKQAEEVVEKAKGTSDAQKLEAALKALNDKLYPIEERLSQFRAKDVQDLTNYGNGLDDRFANLLGMAGRADAPPTEQSYELLEDLSERLKQKVDALNEVIQNEWVPFAGKVGRTL
jgi:hypothetical protein